MGCWSFLLPALCLLIIGTSSTDTNVTESGCEPLVSGLAVMTVKIAKMETEIEEKNEELMKKDKENQQLLDKLAILENHSISGEWGSWTEWSSCNTTFGEGVRERRRQCDNPAPACGGAICPGEEGGESEILIKISFSTS